MSVPSSEKWPSRRDSQVSDRRRLAAACEPVARLDLRGRHAQLGALVLDVLVRGVGLAQDVVREPVALAPVELALGRALF